MTAPAAIRGKLDLTGAADLYNALRGVDLSTGKSILRRGLRAGANVIKPNVQSLIHNHTGRLSQSIKVRAVSNNRKGQVAVAVTTGEATFVGDTYYGGMVEWGHLTGARSASGRIRLRNGRIRQLATGKARKKVAGEHFMAYGFDEAKDAALDAVVQSIREDVDRVMAGRSATSGGES